MNSPKVTQSICRCIAGLLLLAFAGASLVACYPVGHRYHTPDEHAESLQRMNPPDSPNDEFF